MNELNQIFVDAVRSTGGNNEKRILQLQTFLSSRSANALNSFKVPDDIYPNKLIAHVHSYPATWDEKVEQDFIDLNNLKTINDTYGHDKGNIAIMKLANMICEVFSKSPVFRIGGDEFAVILFKKDYRIL